jgi:hypothetical protein
LTSIHLSVAVPVSVSPWTRVIDMHSSTRYSLPSWSVAVWLAMTCFVLGMVGCLFRGVRFAVHAFIERLAVSPCIHCPVDTCVVASFSWGMK